ncbi:hypothetical protein HUJ04_011212 [Dendroctonus ponderosae]|nr:hypothetical protein HUJ04_011212 [Dendroctonus ponderosae]
MFDEIALQLGLQYNYKLDCGFVDLGGADRRPKFADHALVFLLKGIRKKWKQPICFTFCEGTTQIADLINLIKSVVCKVCETGLSIVATVSDQGATNAAAIRSLIQDTQRLCIRKGVDNRYQDGVRKVASWDHLVQLYRMDSNFANFSLICKLTDEHVLASKLKKMSVKHCTQEFSKTVASVMKVNAHWAGITVDLNQSSAYYLDSKAIKDIQKTTLL